MGSSNLIVTLTSKNGMVLTCWVNPTDPLYIYELIIKGIPNLGATIGTVNPAVPKGTAVQHTIYVDSNDPILNKQAPCTITVSYEDGTYRVLSAIAPLIAHTLFDCPLPDLAAAEMGIYVTQVLRAAGPVLNPDAAVLPLIDPVPPADLAPLVEAAHQHSKGPHHQTGN